MDKLSETDLIACPQCDLLHHKTPLAPHTKACCVRCKASLYQYHAINIDYLIAIIITALITFAIANTFPIVELNAYGLTTQTTLIGAITQLWADKEYLVASIVLCSTVLFPLFELIGLLYLLIYLRIKRYSRFFNAVYRGILALRPWGMLEVLLVGMLVSLVKLADFARLILEPALFAFGALTLLITIIVAFNPRTLWNLR